MQRGLAFLPERAQMRGRLPAMRRSPPPRAHQMNRGKRAGIAQGVIRWSGSGHRSAPFVTATVAACVATLSILVAPAAAVTLYVRATGSDAASGRSPELAFASIGRGANEARAGDTVIVGPGVYREGGISPRGAGRSGEPVRFVANRDGLLTGDPPADVLVDATGFQRGFNISGLPWVTVNGFGVTNAGDEGIAIKSGADNTIVANCIVFSNGGRGIRVRDSADVIVFNNLVYANEETGIEFGGELSGTPRAVAIGNTMYANGLSRTGTNLDGMRVEAVIPARNVTVLGNIMDANRGFGLNLKEASRKGFVAQWNLNTDGYNTADIATGALDVQQKPLFIDPFGPDGELGGESHGDDDFRLSEQAAGQAGTSPAIDATPFQPRHLALLAASTRTDSGPDTDTVDLGFHYRNESDFVSGIKKSPRKRLKQMRRLAVRCDKAMARARAQRARGRGACVKKRARRELGKRCGGAVETLCLR
jgi:parallel beta-helix repeat protein